MKNLISKPSICPNDEAQKRFENILYIMYLTIFFLYSFYIFIFSAQDFKIDIPSDLECKDCTIRLVRQALEWGDKYYFQSCADVDIGIVLYIYFMFYFIFLRDIDFNFFPFLVKPGEYAEDCSGHGTPFAGRCRCNRNYYGHR